VGVLHVVGGDLLDALVADLVEVHGGVERQPREDRHLRGGVLAVDILAGIGLGVAEPLGVGEGVGVRAAGARHLREDVVRRPVDDPVHAIDMRGRERLLQDADDRHDARDRGLEAQLHAVLARGRPQLLAVLAEQLLVRGHDVAAGTHRAQDVVARRLEAADELDDEVAAGEDRVEVAAAARQDAADLGAQPGDRGHVIGALGEQRLERGTDGAVTEQADPEGVRGLRHGRGAGP
jgi:hypothetical protein